MDQNSPLDFSHLASSVRRFNVEGIFSVKLTRAQYSGGLASRGCAARRAVGERQSQRGLLRGFFPSKIQSYTRVGTDL